MIDEITALKKKLDEIESKFYELKALIAQAIENSEKLAEMKKAPEEELVNAD